MSRIILILTVFAVSSCSLFDPFIDRRRDAGAKPEDLYVGESKPEAPAVCYNIMTVDYAGVKKLADEECVKQGTGTEAKPVKQTIFTCRLLVPNHVYFKCVNPIENEEEILKQVQDDN